MNHISHLHGATACSAVVSVPNTFLPGGPAVVFIQHAALLIQYLKEGLPTSRIPVNARLLGASFVPEHNVLLVLTDHAHPRVLVFRPSREGAEGVSDLIISKVISLEERVRAQAEVGTGLDYSPEAGLATTHTHAGALKISPMAKEIDPVAGWTARLPHPHLIAHSILRSSAPAVALLSVSSVPTEIAGLGDQCLPVLSFHTVDSANQDLAPLPWGTAARPTRTKVPAAASDTSSGRPQGKYGPAALGAINKKTENVPSELVQAHVPLSPNDAIGAHFLTALPGSTGAAVLVACEQAILVVGNPVAASNKFGKSPQGATAATKRRKSSKGERSFSASGKNGEALGTSPEVSANDNGKRPQRRKSSAAAGASSVTPTSPSRPHEAGSDPGIWRAALPGATQVRASVELKEPNEASAICVADDGQSASLRILLGTHAGRLLLAEMALRPETEGSAPWTPMSVTVRELGSIPAPQGPDALAYLGEGILAVASASGDSELVRLPPALGNPSFTSSSRLDSVHTMPCLAPALDFVVDDGNCGPAGVEGAQARAITASGTGPTGSLRVVRQGVQLDTLVEFGVPNVDAAWPIRSGNSIICSSPAKTLVLELGLDIRDVTSTWDIQAKVTTIAARQTQQGVQGVVHLNAKELLMLHNDGKRVASLPAPSDSEFVGGAIQGSGSVLLAARNGSVSYLEPSIEGWKEVASISFDNDEVSAVDASPLQSGASSAYAAVSLWKSRTIKVLKLPSLEDVTPSALRQSQASLPKSVLLHSFPSAGCKAGSPHLLVSFASGALALHSLALPGAESFSKNVVVVESRVSALGTQPARLRPFYTTKGLHAVLVASDRPAVLSCDHSTSSARVQFSVLPSAGGAVVSDAIPLETPEGSALGLVQRDSIRVVSIGEVQRLDVSTAVDLGHDNPLALALVPWARALLVTSWRFRPQGSVDPDPPAGKIHVFDAETFEGPASSPVVVVGTGTAQPDQSETTCGRLLGFHLNDRKLSVAFDESVEGNVFAICQVNGMIAAAINAEVHVYAIDAADLDDMSTSQGPSGQPFTLRKVGRWGCAFVACTLSVHDNYLIVGDGMRSIAVLAVSNLPTQRGKLSEVARDADPFWTSAAEMLDEAAQTYIGADIALNLFTTQRAVKTAAEKRRRQSKRIHDLEMGRASTGSLSTLAPDSEDDQWSHAMERRAAYHYGDMVNKMRRGALTAAVSAGPGTGEGSSEMSAESKILFCTSAGAIGVITQLDAESGTILTALERNLIQLLASKQTEGSKDIDVQDWRTLRTDHRTSPPILRTINGAM
ncbi:Damage-specific DNA binding complex, subunit DDB1 [Ceraceosorus bombacis]|uniref:Damage-specific DNA binding complex, subunit DDB1 n=1 Tax=Ceraceosorus bombacis TaxID=401625 RepID=A0A0P1BIY3_9BASI|nr:Damage-specific DNA binding complex, subunit DDB1 [Ceraceosorus bombacis]